VDQDVTIPVGANSLSFWLEIPVADNPGFLNVEIDNTVVFSVTEADAGSYATYTEVIVDITAFADGGSHNLEFYSEVSAGTNVTNFFVDDVSIPVSSVAACDNPVDIPWLSVSPAAGTTVSGTTSTVDVTFDSTGLSEGTYTGSLCIDSNDTSTPRVEVPVTLTVSAPTYGVRIAPTAALTGTAGTAVTYTLQVTNTGNTVDTFDLAVSGNSWPTTASVGSVTLNVGESTAVTVVVDIPSTAGDGDMDSATVTATSQSDAGATDSATLTTTAAAAGPTTIYLPVVRKD
jgi:uncharacterized membrane protein